MKLNASTVSSVLVTIIAIGATLWNYFPVGSMAARQVVGGISSVSPLENNLQLQQLGDYAINTHNSLAVRAGPHSRDA